MQRHHQAVLGRHPGHLPHQVPAQRGGLLGEQVSLPGEVEQVDGLTEIEALGADIGVTVVGRDGPWMRK